MAVNTAPANAAATVTINRVGGATRYDTSAMIASTKYPTGVPSGNVVLATGLNFPDALAGNYLAGQLQAPILLTTFNTSDPNYPIVTAALAKLLNGATKNVWILGGAAAVDPSVSTDLKAKGYTVVTISGPTRYDTAQAADTQTGQTPGNGFSGNRTAIVATGTGFADALAAGPLAWAKKFPVVLTDGTQTTLSAQAAATLTAGAIKNVVIMGGASAINPGINTAIKAMGITIDKQFAGANRNDTAAQFLAYIQATYGFVNTSLILASGVNFPDALSAGPWGGDPQGIIESAAADLSAESTATCTALKATLAVINVAGGLTAEPDANVKTCQTAATTTTTAASEPFQLVAEPVLQSASITAGPAPGGTQFAYKFDRPLSNTPAPTPALFSIWTSTGAGGAPAENPCGAATAAVVSSTDNTTALVTYGGCTAAAAGLIAALELATNDIGAVSGIAQGSIPSNPTDAVPNGDAILGTAGSSLAARATPDPVALSAGNFRADPLAPVAAPATLVDITFDKTATVAAGFLGGAVAAAATGFHMILVNGVSGFGTTPASTASDRGCSYVSGTGTKTVTVSCVYPASNGPLSATTVARALVFPATVSAFGAGNVLTTADVASAGQQLNQPGLVSITASLNVAALNPAGGQVDRLTYKFNRDVNLAGGVNGPPAIAGTGAFNGYTAGGVTVVDNGAQCIPAASCSEQRSTSDPTVVAVDFGPTGSLTNVTGGSINDGAVVNAAGTPTLQLNEEHERGILNPSGTGLTPGKLAAPAPNFVSNVVASQRDAFGNITTYFGIFTFDTALTLASVPVPGSLHEITGDGTRLNCTATAPVSASAPNSAICVAWVVATVGGTPSLAQLAAAKVSGVDEAAVTSATGGMVNADGAEPANVT